MPGLFAHIPADANVARTMRRLIFDGLQPLPIPMRVGVVLPAGFNLEFSHLTNQQGFHVGFHPNSTSQKVLPARFHQVQQW